MGHFLDRIYSKCFVGIAQRDGELEIGVLRFKNADQLHEELQRFARDDESKIVGFLNDHVGSTPLNYIALLGEKGVGSLPTCSVSKAVSMDPRVEHSRRICIDDEWMDYMDEEALYALRETCSGLAPDAIYSPFSLLHACYDYRMQDDHAAYLLISQNGMSLAVVKQRTLRFAMYFTLEKRTPVMKIVRHVSEAVTKYYGQPCCRGEFIEAVVVADSADLGDDLPLALEASLLVPVEHDTIPASLLAARTCAKELGYGL